MNHSPQTPARASVLETVAAGEADGQEDDERQDEDDQDDDQDHLLVLPPHLAPDRDACSMEAVRLEAQIVRLVHQLLYVLPSREHLRRRVTFPYVFTDGSIQEIDAQAIFLVLLKGSAETSCPGCNTLYGVPVR